MARGSSGCGVRASEVTRYYEVVRELYSKVFVILYPSWDTQLYEKYRPKPLYRVQQRDYYYDGKYDIRKEEVRCLDWELMNLLAEYLSGVLDEDDPVRITRLGKAIEEGDSEIMRRIFYAANPAELKLRYEVNGATDEEYYYCPTGVFIVKRYEKWRHELSRPIMENTTIEVKLGNEGRSIEEIIADLKKEPEGMIEFYERTTGWRPSIISPEVVRFLMDLGINPSTIANAEIEVKKYATVYRSSCRASMVSGSDSFTLYGEVELKDTWLVETQCGPDRDYARAYKYEIKRGAIVYIESHDIGGTYYGGTTIYVYAPELEEFAERRLREEGEEEN